MKKYTMIDKDFDGFMIFLPGESSHDKEFLTKNRLEDKKAWKDDISRYFIGWFPVEYRIAVPTGRNYYSTIVKFK